MTRKKCPQCQLKNPSDATFCGECGARLPDEPLVLCPHCGKKNPKSARFCVFCGEEIKRFNIWPLALAGIGILLLLVAAGGLILWKSGVWEEFMDWPSLAAETRTVRESERQDKDNEESDRPEEAAAEGRIEVEDKDEQGDGSQESVMTATQPPTKMPESTSLLSTTPIATATATPSPAPSDTPFPSDTPTPILSPTKMPTPTSLPSRTPTPGAAVCTASVYSDFAAVWRANANELGCAAAPAADTWMAQERFDNGRMFWRKDTDKIYVLYNSGYWNLYNNIWYEGDPSFSCGVAASPPTPQRGFGKIWCTYSDVRSGLGNAANEEWGDTGMVQTFTGGFILRTAGGQVYTFLNSGGWWRQ